MRPAHPAAVPEPGTALEMALATSGAGSVELHYSYLFCPASELSEYLLDVIGTTVPEVNPSTLMFL